jgi:hypothetical protein
MSLYRFAIIIEDSDSCGNTWEYFGGEKKHQNDAYMDKNYGAKAGALIIVDKETVWDDSAILRKAKRNPDGSLFLDADGEPTMENIYVPSRKPMRAEWKDEGFDHSQREVTKEPNKQGITSGVEYSRRHRQKVYYVEFDDLDTFVKFMTDNYVRIDTRDTVSQWEDAPELRIRYLKFL